MKRPLILLSCLALVSCGTKPGDQQSVGAPLQTAEAKPARFSITYQGAFKAGTADHKDQRAVYVIVDTQTGQEYLGIEGVGVSGLRKVTDDTSAEH